jgi:hypothetical protein
MRIQQITINEVTDACARIGDLVYKMGFTGPVALKLEQRIYHALFTELLDNEATAAALDYVALRHRRVSDELDTLARLAGDLDLVEQAQMAEAVAMSETVEIARAAGML